MTRFIFRSLIVAAIVLSAIFAALAQPTDGKTIGSVPERKLIGEVLKYDAKVNRILHGISVAELTLSVAVVPNSTDLVVKSEAVSKGTLLKIFRYSFLQQYESTIDASLRVLKTAKHDVQKERVRDSEAIFDYGRRMVTFVETDPEDRSRAPRRIASEIGASVLDMLSAIYYIRMQTLAVGKRFDLSISDSGLVYKIPVTVTGREMQNTILGDLWCYRVEPDIFGTGRLIEQKGKMVIWIADDARHTPVHSQIDSSVGKIDIKLKSATKPR